MNKATDQIEEVILTMLDFCDLTLTVDVRCMCNCFVEKWEIYIN